MYTQSEKPQYPSLWSSIISTFKIWRQGWGVFSLINLATVVTGTIAWMNIVAVMPWLKTLIIEGKNIDPTIISNHYSTPFSLIADLGLVSLILLSFIICIVISQVMTIYAIDPAIRNQGFKHLLITSLRRTPYYLWTVSILSMIILGGMALLVIPGVLLIPLAIITVFIATLENTYGMRAVIKGAWYLKGHGIEILWRSLLVILIIQATSLMLPLLATLLVYPFTLLNFSPYTIRVLSFVAGTLYTFVSFVLSLILPSLLMIFYFNLYSFVKDHPIENKKPLHRHLIKVLAWIGIIFIISLLSLEAFGV